MANSINGEERETNEERKKAIYSAAKSANEKNVCSGKASVISKISQYGNNEKRA
jgi:murein tripeptide amidase MpaA